jgi:capsular polysaccharide biosynthesis protein
LKPAQENRVHYFPSFPPIIVKIVIAAICGAVSAVVKVLFEHALDE